VQSGLGQAWDRTQADAANAFFSVFLGGDDNQSLDLRPPADCASLLPTPVSLVYVDDASNRSRPGRTMARRNLCNIAQAVL